MDPRDYEQRVQTVCLLILTAIAIGAGLYLLRPVLIPFVLAVFLVYCLTPAIDVQVEHARIPRPVAVINTILVGGVILFGVWLLVWASVSQMSENAGDYAARITALLDGAAEHLPLKMFGLDGQELQSVLPQDAARGLLGRVISAIMSILSNALLVVIFMIFLMAGTTSAPPAGGIREKINRHIKRYILTKVLVSAFTGILVGLTLWLLGVELALVFGLFAFLLNFIPNIGSVVATLLPLPVVWLSPDMSLPAKVLAIAVPGGIQFAVGNLVEPRVMGRSLDLHPVVVLLGLIFFGMIWGIIGMILATPIVAVVKIILERLEVTAPAARLLTGRLDR